MGTLGAVTYLAPRHSSTPLVVEQVRTAVAEDGMTIALVTVGVLVCLAGVYAGLRTYVHAYRIWSNEPIPAGDVHLAEDVIEVEGTAEILEDTVTARYTNTECVVYSYEKERRKTRRDSDGNRERYWDTVASGGDSVPFLVRDDTGSVAVDPSNGELAPRTEYSSQSGNVRKTEKRLEPGDDVHVYGQKRAAVERRDDGLADQRYYVGDGDSVSTFKVTEGSERWTVLRTVGKATVVTAVAGVFAVFGIAFLADLTGIAF